MSFNKLKKKKLEAKFTYSCLANFHFWDNLSEKLATLYSMKEQKWGGKSKQTTNRNFEVKAERFFKKEQDLYNLFFFLCAKR